MRDLEQQVEAMMRLCLADKETDRDRLRQEIRGYLRSKRKASADPEQEIRQILLELGAPDHLAGHPYVVRGVLLVMSDRLYINNMTFGLYPQLAKDFDTTASRVERAIRHLVEVTWARGDMEVLDRYFGNTISASRGKPTNGEFIARLSNVVKERMKQLS